MDYLLADAIGVPPEHVNQFTEQIAYLPETRLCFTPPANAPAVSPAPTFTRGYVTFGCFQSLSKIDDRVLDAWVDILRSLPDAHLRLQNKAFGDAEVRARFTARIQEKGIDKGRVAMFAYTARDDYLAAYGEVDVLLDTFAYPGGTTTCEALWMGVPTITLAGDTLLARQGASLLMAAGLETWIAYSVDEYIDKALAFARDRSGLSELRAGLREQVRTSSLCDAARFARGLEDVLASLWQRWRDDQTRKGGTN
jgi:predicted O-linked N-acetylglucosamine transferase (SPINDLY family)